ncbi:MAG: membrane protein [Ktedonobacteraceae bacterium]
MSTLRKPHLIKYMPEANVDLVRDTYRRATWLGFATGLRSMTPNALLAWTSEQPSPLLRGITAFLAVGESIGDKLPLTPSRLNSGPFFGRLAFGALAGALVSQRFNQDQWQGAIRGALGAAAGSFIGYSYRSLLSQGLGVPDFVGAIVEDGVAITVGLNAVSKTPEKL